MIDNTIKVAKRLAVFVLGSALVAVGVLALGAVAILGAAVSLVGGLVGITGLGLFAIFLLMMYLIHGEIHETGKALWERVFE